LLDKRYKFSAKWINCVACLAYGSGKEVVVSERESVAEQNEERGTDIGVVEERKEEEKRKDGERQG
jgi:hypothetical protein